jgi:hypothetical protein
MPSLYFRVLHLVDDDLDVLDSSLGFLHLWIPRNRLFLCSRSMLKRVEVDVESRKRKLESSEEGVEGTGAVEVTGGGGGEGRRRRWRRVARGGTD